MYFSEKPLQLVGLVLALGTSALAEQTETDRRLLATVFPNHAPAAPAQLFSAPVREIIRAEANGTREQTPFFRIPRHTPSPQADRWKTIPPEAWRKIIAAHAPLTLSTCRATCPFCGKPLPPVRCDLLRTPRRGTTLCCGKTIYATADDAPPGERESPNESLAIPHPDGRSHTYHFIVPADGKSDPARWFCPAGELWWTRLYQLVYKVIPDLGHAVYRNNDADAARTLAVIYDRLADVFPTIPYTDMTRPLGFARELDVIQRSNNDGLLTASAWRAELRRRRVVNAPYSTWNTTCFKLHHPGDHASDNGLIPMGILAEAFELARSHAAFQSVSRQRHGTPTALETRIRERVFSEAALYFRDKQPTLTSAMSVWFNNAIKLAVAAREPTFLSKIATCLEGFQRNHFYPDGLSIEGSFDEAARIGWYARSPWIAEAYLGGDMRSRYPFAARIHALGDDPVLSLLNIASRHGDADTAFFTSLHHAPPAPLPYAQRERSWNFPFYGLTCLRGGGAGRRLEVLMDYQNTVRHTHAGRLNLQLFYEGVNLLPDIGSDTGNADVTQAPWNALDTRLPLVPAPGIAAAMDAHCTGAINGTQLDKWALVFQRYLGATTHTGVTALAQCIEVDGHHTYDHVAAVLGTPVFNRQVVTIALPGDRACVLDVFRMEGGRRHDLFWHLPAASPACSLGAAQAAAEDTLHAWFAQHADPGPGWLKETEYLYSSYTAAGKPFRESLHHFHAPRIRTATTNMWTLTWLVDPARYAPVTAEGQAAYAPWEPHLKPVTLRMWGHAEGTPDATQMLIESDVPWAANAEMRIAARVAFTNGLNALTVHRQARSDGLRSTFAHVLEPFTPAQGPALHDVVPLEPDHPPTGGGTALRLRCATGETLYVGTALGAGAFSSAAFSFTGRLAVVDPRRERVLLFDGTHARGEHLAVSVGDSLQSSVEQVIGDLSGQPDQSALVVHATRPLPTGDLLKGQTLTIHHQVGDAHTSGYPISRVTALGTDRYRIDLLHQPPFIHHAFRVADYRPAYPKRIATDMKLFDGVARPTGLNRLVRFPRTGFVATIAGMSAEGDAGESSRILHLDRVPAAEMIQQGDPVLIYTVQPGDAVVIPSLFAMQRHPIDALERELEIHTHTEATVQLSERLRVRKREGSVTVTRSHEATALTVPAGHHRIILTRWR